MATTPQSLNDVLKIAGRRKWSFLLPFFLVCIAGATLALLLPSVYKSSATILIESQEIPKEFVMSTITTFVEQRLQSINQRIMSTTKLLEIINKLDLYKKYRDKWTTEELVEKMREDVKLQPISTEVVDQRTGRPSVATIAFMLTFEGKEAPGTVQKVADTLTSLFMEENLQIRERQTEEISQFLSDEVQRQREILADLEAKIARFREKHINEVPEMLQVNIQALNTVERNMERFENQLMVLREREGYLQTQLATIDPAGLNHPDQLRLEELKVQYVALKSRVSENHPDLKKTRAEIDELQKRVSANGNGRKAEQRKPENPAYITLASQLSGTQCDIAFIKEQIKYLGLQKEIYQKRVEATPRVEQDYNTFLIERRTAQVKFDDLMRKIMEAQIAYNLEKEQKGERFILIDPPQLPEKPFKPNRMTIILLSFILGIGAGTGLAFAREMSDLSVRTVDELATATAFPVLATVREIVTQNDKRRRRVRQLVRIAAILAAAGAAVVIFHYFVMDLDIFRVKVLRYLNRIDI